MTAWTHHDPAVRKLIRQAQAEVLREAATSLSEWPNTIAGSFRAAEYSGHYAGWLNTYADQIEETR